MKIFISWSGNLSKEIAEIFRNWIPGVLQATNPYYSPDDITKGTRWNSEISKKLDASKIGIICLTKQNLNEPWIMFEAGALSKNLEKSKVCPLLFGVKTSEIQGPLIQFQAAEFSKAEMLKVIKMINSQLDEEALKPKVLDEVFNMWWPKLEIQINEVQKKAELADDGIIRADRDILEEILSISRALSIANDKIDKEYFNKEIFEKLINDIEEISFKSGCFDVKGPFDKDEDLFDLFQKLLVPIESILDNGRVAWGSSFSQRMVKKIKLIRQRLSEKSLKKLQSGMGK